jgi:DNA-binding MarR family transcriptional regulator
MEQTTMNMLNDTSACVLLRMAARSTTRFFDLVLQPSRLKASQFITLKTIGEVGEMAQCRFARDCAIAVETLSRRLGVLRRKGLISCRVGKHGERIYTLTAAGREALLKATPYWERAQSRFEQALGDRDMRSLLELCRRVVTAATKAEEMRVPNSAVRASEDASNGLKTIDRKPSLLLFPARFALRIKDASLHRPRIAHY